MRASLLLFPLVRRVLLNCRTAMNFPVCHPEPVSTANEVEGSRTAAELAKRPEDQRDEGSSSRKRSRYRFLVRGALLVLQRSPGQRGRAEKTAAACLSQRWSVVLYSC
jgi:hypothetical protein